MVSATLILSIFIACRDFSSQPREMDPTRHHFLVRSCPGFVPISLIRDSKKKEKAPIIRDGIQGESARLIEVWPCVFIHLSQTGFINFDFAFKETLLEK